MVELTRDTGGAVNENEDHSTKGPSNTEDSDATTRVVSGVSYVGCALVTDNGQDSNVKEEQGGDELSDDSSVERPLDQFF